MPNYTIANPNAQTLDDLIHLYDPKGEGIRLDLGCGSYKKPGFIGLDNLIGAASQIKTNSGPDIIMDLAAQPLPFRDNSVIEIFTAHFLEHAPIDLMLEEMFRVLKPEGAVQIVMPYANSAPGLYPGHSAFYTEQWFLENVHFAGMFTIYEFAWKRTKLYQRIPRIVRQLMGFHLARQVLFNVCDEFMIYCQPKKGAANHVPIKPKRTVYGP